MNPKLNKRLAIGPCLKKTEVLFANLDDPVFVAHHRTCAPECRGSWVSTSLGN